MIENNKFLPLMVFIVTGLVEVFKLTFSIDKRFLPIISLVLGLLVSIGYALSFGLFLDNIFLYVIAGILLGLAGSGLFDNIKKGLEILW